MTHTYTPLGQNPEWLTSSAAEYRRWANIEDAKATDWRERNRLGRARACDRDAANYRAIAADYSARAADSLTNMWNNHNDTG